MPTAMHLIILVSLFAVTICTEAPSSSTMQVTGRTTADAHSTSITVTETLKVTSSTEKINTNTPQLQQTTTAHITVSTKNVSSSTLPSTSSQTPNTTEESNPSRTPETTTNRQTTNETVSHGLTFPTTSESLNITTIKINTTSAAFPHESGNGDLTANPGLVAILCIFCIILVLVLVVAIVKCVQLPRSNFERLEDVPMGNVNEESPFAHYSK